MKDRFDRSQLDDFGPIEWDPAAPPLTAITAEDLFKIHPGPQNQLPCPDRDAECLEMSHEQIIACACYAPELGVCPFMD